MKNTCCAIAAIAILLFANMGFAQTDTANAQKKKHKRSVTISIPGGVSIHNTDTAKTKAGVADNSGVEENKEQKKDPAFKTGLLVFDLGINVLRDNTNYAAPAVKSFLNVPVGKQNASLFDLRQGKSINVNIDPLLVRFKALHTHGQRIYITTGLGLQLYNFRYDQPLTYTRNPVGVTLDTISFKKDKLALDYLNVPLMFTFKTRISKKNWLVYGGGLTEGYRLASWTKQESGARGKVRVHDAFGLADFNTCVSAEIGIEDKFRFYATYQLTSLYTNGLDQHPFSFGFRLAGI
jgi:hypothetical protein